MENNLYEFQPDYLIHPGEYVVEFLETYGMKQTELAIRLGITAKHLNHIIKGKASVTPETAQALEKVFLNPSSYWLDLQMAYDIGIEEQNRKRYCKNNEEECRAWLEQFDCDVFERQGYLEPKKEKGSVFDRVDELLRFFGCADIQSWNDMYRSELPAACRITGAGTAKLGNTSAWLRCGQMIAQKQSCILLGYSREKFKIALGEIRNLTVSGGDFGERMKELCADAGVCLMFVKEIPKSGISGAAFWIRDNTVPCIQMNLRYKKNDHFWFTFFHEAMHILKEHKKIVYLDCEKKEDSEIEREADALAGNLLIPPKTYERFLKRGIFSKEEILSFSREIGIHPGIVVGRLQHDGKIKWSWDNDLKQTIEWRQ